VERGKCATMKSTKGSRGFYLAAVSSDHGGLEWTQLASVGGVLGRRCTLSPAVWWRLSVAEWSGRGGLGFRPGVTEIGLPWVGTTGQGARRGWHGVDVIMPCRFGCGATWVRTRACQNVMPALGALGGSLASAGTVGGASHGRARAKLVRGIGPEGRGESGGEVTGQEMDGGVLTLLGCPRWPWRRQGRRGVLTT
jgi:hypothetical protein